MATQNNRNTITLSLPNFIKAINGDEACYYAFKNYLTKSAKGYLSDIKDHYDDMMIDDIVQDAIIECADMVNNGSAPRAIKPYIYKVVINGLKDWKKQDSRRIKLNSIIDDEESDNSDYGQNQRTCISARDRETIEIFNEGSDLSREIDVQQIAKEIFDYVKEEYGDQIYRMLQVKNDIQLSERDIKQLATLHSQCVDKKIKGDPYLTFLSSTMGLSKKQIQDKITYYEKLLKVYVKKHVITLPQYKDVMTWVPNLQVTPFFSSCDMNLEEASRLICNIAFLQDNIELLNIPQCKRLPLEETLGKDTIEMFHRIEEYQFDSDETSEIRSMSDVREDVDLIIVDKEPLLQIYKAEMAGCHESRQKLEGIINDMRRQSRENDTPVNSETLEELQMAIADINIVEKEIRTEFEDLGPDWKNYLGLYTRCFPILNINSPTIVLFRDAIEKDSVFGSAGEEYAKKRNNLFAIVYTHELFHAYFDSPTYDKNPDPKIEETMANFGMLYLINKVFESGETILLEADVHTMIFCSDNDQPFEYYFGYELYQQTAGYDDRFRIIQTYRELSMFIDLSIDYNEACHLYDKVMNRSNVFKSIRSILNIDHWPTWYRLGQLPRFRNR